MVEQRRVAQRGSWFFDVYFGQGTGDSVVYTGDGVDDLNRLLSAWYSGTLKGATMRCDVSPSSYSEYRLCDHEDVMAIRGYFMGWYGTVAKPDAYVERTSVAYPQQTIQVVV